MKLVNKICDVMETKSLVCDEEGQAAAEYGLIIVGAATLAGLVIAWAGGGSITSLFNKVISNVIGRF